ncbi:peptide chain release factor 2 [Candidiatus Paracoxiella cheracis]|uniref:peptide chain release factor 2 n=1 Tax=Candidiatus Paracoxiella cheracis TaxID=3405120 RepID=UPI003BF58D68
MLEINALREKLDDLKSRLEALRGYLDLDVKDRRLLEVQRELENPSIWEDPDKAQSLSRERVSLESVVKGNQSLVTSIADAYELLEFVKQDQDNDIYSELLNEVDRIEKNVSEMEFRRMFSGEMDSHNAYLDIQAGSGGTEAQDWAEMLLRMYLRWGDQHGFQTTLLEASAGEVAGIKSATIECKGEYAFGWLRTETGVHRLVRKSPFDSGNRRHTSFASVFVSPEINDDVEIEINPADLRIDTYRASGAGGQHVNRTDSAVRITHMPSGIVVQCQNDRSQHKNKAQAMKQLRAKLYELEMQKKNEKQAELEASKSEISWGSQIRSYVLDAARIKDLRTGVETSNTQAVLDGDIDKFIEACLKQEE